MILFCFSHFVHAMTAVLSWHVHSFYSDNCQNLDQGKIKFTPNLDFIVKSNWNGLLDDIIYCLDASAGWGIWQGNLLPTVFFHKAPIFCTLPGPRWQQPSGWYLPQCIFVQTLIFIYHQRPEHSQDYKINTISPDALVIQGARASTVLMILMEWCGYFCLSW